MEAEQEFAVQISGRILAIETLLIRMMAGMPEANRLLDEAEAIIDKTYTDRSHEVQPDIHSTFLQMLKFASESIINMRQFNFE